MIAALLGAAAGAALGAVALGFIYPQTPTQASSGARGRPACTMQKTHSKIIARRFEMALYP
jgi:hypothetical protein